MTGNQSVLLSIEGMSCASCVGRVDRALSGLEGIGDVSVNLANETARMTVDGPERLAEAADTLDKLGYPARRASVTLNIASMSCASCVGRVDKAIAAVPGVLEVNVNPCLSPDAGFAAALQTAGIDFDDAMHWLVQAAVCGHSATRVSTEV